ATCTVRSAHPEIRSAPTSASTRREALVISATPNLRLPPSNPECWKLEAEKGSSNGRDRIVKEPTECGDASACLMLRTPVIRRDRCRLVQKMCPVKERGSWPDFAESQTKQRLMERSELRRRRTGSSLRRRGEAGDQNVCTRAILARPIRTSSCRHW